MDREIKHRKLNTQFTKNTYIFCVNKYRIKEHPLNLLLFNGEVTVIKSSKANNACRKLTMTIHFIRKLSLFSCYG